MKTKYCPHCKKDKPVEDFSKHKSRKDGLQPYCKTCMLGLQREHFSSNSGYYVAKNRQCRARLREIVKQAKSKPCMDCGHVYPYYVMDFDHVRGKKLMEINRLVVFQSHIKLMEEIQKCDVVCSNCHRIRTHKRSGASDRISTRASRSEDERDMQFHHGGDS